MLLKAIVLFTLITSGLMAHADLNCESDLLEDGAIPLLEDVVTNHKIATAAMRGGLDFLLLPVPAAEAIRILGEAGSTLPGDGALPVTDRLSNSWLQSSELSQNPEQVYAIVNPDALATGPWHISGGSPRLRTESYRSTPPQIRELFHALSDEQGLRSRIRHRVYFSRGISQTQILGFFADSGSGLMTSPLWQTLRRLHSEIPVIESRDLGVLRRFVRIGSLPTD